MKHIDKRIRMFFLFLSCLLLGSCITPGTTHEVQNSMDLDSVKTLPECSEQLLLEAAEEGDIETVRRCLQAGIDPNVADRVGFSALMFAICEKHSDVALALIDAGAEVNAVNDFESTAFGYAVNYELDVVAMQMIDSGLDLTVVLKDRFTPLVLAASAGRPVIVDIVLRKLGAKVTPQELVNAHLSARNFGHEKVINQLLAVGVDPLPDEPEIMNLGYRYIPKNIEDSFRTLDIWLTKEERAYLKTDLEALVHQHIGVGLWIRNEWGLGINSRLAQFFKAKGIDEPDIMSAKVVEQYVQYLQD